MCHRDVASDLQIAGLGISISGRGQRLSADHGVLLHDFELCRRQRTRLEQNRVRNAHLADVVQRTR